MKLDTPYAVLDVEARGGTWDKFWLAWFRTSTGEAIECTTAELLGECVKRFQGPVFTLFGGRYDNFFLPRPSSVTLSGSGILRAQVGKAAVYDAWFLFQMSLAKLGKAVGHLKFEGKSDRMAELTQDEASAHCYNDCGVLLTALEKHRQWCATRPHPLPRWPMTAGSTAVYCLEALEPEGFARLSAQELEASEWMQHYAAVSGGRVELWQLGRVKGPVYSYDINSSYPQSWCDAPLPLGPWRAVTGERRGAAGVYRCTVRQSREHLPVVAPMHVWRYDGEAWLTSEEVAAVRELGGAVDVHEGWVSDSSEWFGRDFATSLYAAKNAGDPWAKVGVNAAHGKLQQSIIQTEHRWRERAWAAELTLSLPNWHQRPIIGCFVLARARLRLHATLEKLRAAGWKVLYVDTDCVHTDCPPEKFPGALSGALGEWKLETTAVEACYVAPKVYGLKLGDGSVKLASKGLPKKLVTWEVLTRAAKGERVALREAAGLQSFLSIQGEPWGAYAAERRRALVTQTGGKRRKTSKHGQETGELVYRDA